MPASEVFDLPVTITSVFSRGGARRLAAAFAIPPGVKEVVLTFVGPLFFSLVAELIRDMRLRLPSEVRLSVSYPRGGLPEDFVRIFENQDVRFIER